MKVIPLIALFALSHFACLTLTADVDFAFDDADGSSVASSSNTGSTSGTWTSDSPLLIEGGSLNIGFTENNKSTHVNNNNTDDTFTLGTPIDSGKYIFEVVLSGHDISASWNNPYMSFEKLAKFALIDVLKWWENRD